MRGKQMGAWTFMWVGLLGQAWAAAGDLTAEIRDASGRPVPDGVVLIIPVDDRKALAPQPRLRMEIDQINQEFVPYVTVVPLGTEILFPNKDNIRHQVYSFSSAKRFELPLYSGRSAPPVRFETPGIIILGCNIHDWMLAYVYVTEAPYFGKTGPDGRLTVANLPAGDYTVRIWHPRLKGNERDTARRTSIPAAGTATLQWQVALREDKRIRRHLKGDEDGYR